MNRLEKPWGDLLGGNSWVSPPGKWLKVGHVGHLFFLLHGGFLLYLQAFFPEQGGV